MKYVLIYYTKSKYLGFTKKHQVETDSIFYINQIIKHDDVVNFYIYELRGEKNG